MFSSTPPVSPTVGGSYAVAATGGGSGNPVTFTIDASSTVGACSISTTVVSFTAAGSCVVDANQAGNANYLAAAQVHQSLTVAVVTSKAPQTIVFTSTPPASPTIGGSYTVAAHGGGSANPVTFTLDASSAAGACSLSGATITFTGKGSCVVDANQAGNANYLAAAQVHQSLTVTVTAAGIAALTLHYVQSSATYQTLNARQKVVVTVATNLVSSVLAGVGPRLTVAQKIALVNLYKTGVAALRANGYLTATQATTLDTAASEL